MSFVTGKRKSLALSLLAASSIPLSALATPSVTSPYVVDAQNSHVQDATSEGIANLNMVLCIMNAMQPAVMVNSGDYIALIDKNKCDSKSQSSASNSTSAASGATATPDYMTAVVNSSRASNADPMIAKSWISFTEEGNPVEVFVQVSATRSPTDAPPYGQFRMDYIGKAGGATKFNGFIDANGADVSYFETGPNSSDNALAMRASSATAGSGTMMVPDFSTNPATSSTFNFAYDSSETAFPAGVFRRSDGTNDVCFDRSVANAQKSVWRFGTYNANDGARVDQANPGFPITVAYNGNSYYGYAGYWGINFQGLDLNSIADGILAGAVVADQRPGNSTTYRLAKNSGKLTKWTQHQQTLAAMDGIPFTFYGDLTGQTGNNTISGFGNWQMQWNNSSSTFSVTGKQTCGNKGCVLSSISPTATVTGVMLNGLPIAGWSDSFGGNINIPPTGSAHTGTDAVNYYSQSAVIPGDVNAPSALYCLSNCPTAASLVNFATNNGNVTPFDSTTAQQWGWGSTSVTYSFDATGLKETSAPMVISNANLLTGQFQGGIMTGRLFPAPLPTTGCPSGGAVCEPGNPATYYTWQTGANQWNQTTWLTRIGDSSVVSFDPPQNISYTVPTGAAYGSWSGKAIQLQFNGFGNLNGIPGYCVSPIDNSQVDCGATGARYVPEFSLPDGATMTLMDGGTSTPLIVKALDAELRLSKVACGLTALPPPGTTVTLPTAADVHDPSNSVDSDYIGTKPAVASAPQVIDGVVQ